jgi:hypothetical protein
MQNVHGFEITFSKQSALPEREDDGLNETSKEGKLGIRTKKRNATGISSFTTFLTEGMLMILHQAMTPEWSSGLAYQVIEMLTRKLS